MYLENNENCLNYYFTMYLRCFTVVKFIKILGIGGDGEVVLAENSSNQLFAIKIIPKNLEPVILKEIKILFPSLPLQHDHIVDYINFFSDTKYVNIVMEYCEKGSLEDYFQNRKNFSEFVSFIYFCFPFKIIILFFFFFYY
jgi:serine/threonine protein kinase